MTTLLLGYRHTPVLLLGFTGPRPLLLGCSAELKAAAARAIPTPATGATIAVRAPEAEQDRAASAQGLAEEARARRAVSDWGDDTPPASDRPRPPEVHIDPRTVFRRRTPPTAPVGPRARASEPAIPAAADQPVADYIIVPQLASFRASEQGVKALITYLRTSQIFAAKSEQVRPDGTAVELLPDVFSHLAFTEGAAPPGAPSVLEGTLWFASKPAPLPFGDPTRSACLRIELVGARYPRVVEGFLARLHQILHLRPEVVRSPHDPSRLRGKAPKIAVEPIPRVDMQEL